MPGMFHTPYERNKRTVSHCPRLQHNSVVYAYRVCAVLAESGILQISWAEIQKEADGRRAVLTGIDINGSYCCC